MKCPWQPITITTYGPNGNTTARTNFDECYEGACPFFVDEHKIGSFTVPERCRRPDNETS